jgi:acetyltransferase-like isoleucine patch superfamily enzyme
MGFLTEIQLKAMKFQHLGENVKISDKASIYNPEMITIGDNSRIDDFCVVSGRIKMGRNVHVAVFCNLAGGTEGITLEDFSGLAYGCHIFTQSDDYSGRTLTNPTVPAKFKNETKKAVHVGRHCIIGTNSIIFPGANVKEGTSVGALSVITKPTEEWAIYFGIPAKKIKNREKDLLLLEDQYLAEINEDTI